VLRIFNQPRSPAFSLTTRSGIAAEKGTAYVIGDALDPLGNWCRCHGSFMHIGTCHEKDMILGLGTYMGSWSTPTERFADNQL
jgi:hypothetical protein